LDAWIPLRVLVPNEFNTVIVKLEQTQRALPSQQRRLNNLLRQLIISVFVSRNLRDTILGDDEAQAFSGLASLHSLDVDWMDLNSLLENDCLSRANHAVPVSFVVHQDLYELMSRVLASDENLPMESGWKNDCRTGRSLTRNRSRY
jgi:hypothetical protein